MRQIRMLMAVSILSALLCPGCREPPDPPSKKAVDMAWQRADQRGIIDPQRLAACRATVIGVGAIGRQVALQLAAIGVPTLRLIDPDIVEPVNLACQGYFEEDLNRHKVHATGNLCHQINPALVMEELPERFRRSMPAGEIIFCCVDSIETRRHIWEAVKDNVTFFCDGRMAAEVCRVISVADESSRQHYASTLFDPGQAYAGACTAKSTIYCANMAAGLMVAQFTKFLRRLPIDADIQFNLLTCELSIGGNEVLPHQGDRDPGLMAGIAAANTE